MSESDAPKPTRGARIGSRAGAGIILVATVVFVGISTWHIVEQLFELGPRPTARLAGPCGDGIRALAADLDAESAKSPSSGEAFDDAVQARWSRRPEVERACASTEGGADALASLDRLRRAHRSVAQHAAVNVAPLRAALDGKLGGP